MSAERAYPNVEGMHPDDASRVLAAWYEQFDEPAAPQKRAVSTPTRQASSVSAGNRNGTLREREADVKGLEIGLQEKILEAHGLADATEAERTEYYDGLDPAYQAAEALRVAPELARQYAQESERLRVDAARDLHDARVRTMTELSEPIARLPGLSRHVNPETGLNVLQEAQVESLGDRDPVQGTVTRTFRKLTRNPEDCAVVVDALAGHAIRSHDEELSQPMFDAALAPLPNDNAPSERQAALDALSLDELAKMLDDAPEPEHASTKWVGQRAQEQPGADEQARVIASIKADMEKIR